MSYITFQMSSSFQIVGIDFVASGFSEDDIIYDGKRVSTFFPFDDDNYFSSTGVFDRTGSLSADLVYAEMKRENPVGKIVRFSTYNILSVSEDPVPITSKTISQKLIPTEYYAYDYGGGAFYRVFLDSPIVRQYTYIGDLIDVGTLFTEASDSVNFNNLTSGQLSALQDGANKYDALGGDDIVTLPNAPIEGASWSYTTPFEGGFGIDRITGSAVADIIHGGFDGDFLFGAGGDDVLHGNAGEDAIEGGDDADTLYGDENNDWLYGGKGSDELYGGKDDDKIYGGDDTDKDLLVGGQGKDELTPGVGRENNVYGDDVGAELGFQSQESEDFDTIRLDGSADDYIFILNEPRSKDLLTYIVNSTNADDTNNVFGVEKVLFSSAVKNNVNLYVGSIVNEAARLMVEVYTESTQQSAVSASGAGRNWHAVEAIELGIAPSSGSGGNGYTLVNGVYESEFTFTRTVFGVPVTLANDAVATVQLGMTGGVRTLMVTFKGSDPPGGNFDLGDWLVDLAGATGTFYEHYKPLVDGIKSFVADPVNAIQQVLVSGHSLGGAMAQHFISDISSLVTTTGKTIAGYTFGSIGGTQDTVNFSKNYLTNFLHVNDVANGLNLVNEGRAGSIVRINSTNVDPVTGHFKEEYAKDVGLLMEYARGLTTSSFSQTELAKALGSGPIKELAMACFV